jgi:hypothetical protein
VHSRRTIAPWIDPVVKVAGIRGERTWIEIVHGGVVAWIRHWDQLAGLRNNGLDHWLDDWLDYRLTLVSLILLLGVRWLPRVLLIESRDEGAVTAHVGHDFGGRKMGAMGNI